MKLEDYEFYFSKERIGSYEDIEEHNNNLCLISKISIHLGIFELYLRNRMNTILQEKTEDEEWLFELMRSLRGMNRYELGESAQNMLRDFDRIKKGEYKTHSQIVSRLPFGFWVNLVKILLIEKRIGHVTFIAPRDILDVSKINFKQYSHSNRPLYDDRLKLVFIVRLVQHIRNRAFHWENLLKTYRRNNGKLSSNISATENDNRVSVLPMYIEVFLNDILNCIDEKIKKEMIDSRLAY